jgi:16S rRNA (guanine527-N7)-methyltransferase
MVPIDRIIERQDWDSLAPHLLKVDANFDETTEKLRRYARAVLEWNGRVSNLISFNDMPRIVDRHILESVEPAHWLKSSGAKKWLDLGSGGGFPAIPMVLLGVDEHWTLVESRRNKTLFLRKVAEDFGLTSVEVVLDRLENKVGTSWEAAYDGFTSRATMTLGPTLDLARHFVRPGGVAFLWKGGRREEEMAADERWQKDWELEGLLGIGSGQTVVARFIRKT